MLRSFAMSATRRVQEDRETPWSLNEVLMMKVQTAWRLLLFKLLPTTLIYACKLTPYINLPCGVYGLTLRKVVISLM
jgi:hypothetical protein